VGVGVGGYVVNAASDPRVALIGEGMGAMWTGVRQPGSRL
jgi:hypothetical protein